MEIDKQKREILGKFEKAKMDPNELFKQMGMSQSTLIQG